MSSFSKVLIANRGEIAVRVIRTAKRMGFSTVAVYSEADALAPHTQLADEAVFIGPAPAGESYLCVDKIIQAALKTGAGAIHPGYGFLSENANFAARCKANEIEFIGPPESAIELMGSKRLAKIAMMDAGVPCIPGYQGDDQSEATLIEQATRIGMPVMLKASAGGGGRGMRLVDDVAELADMIKTARSEATNAFGSGELIVEKAVINPRHIEIQVFSDKHGNAIYLGERDCSIQRRHQKVVEEAPSPFVDEPLRKKMGKAAVQAAKACDYVGAGTVEFLVDGQQNFYFLEMNTRLQVEHPVTELITGTDLVAWQLNVALGYPLPLSQDAITLNGHAIEVRLYAEDPANQFVPQTGKIEQWLAAEGEGVRIDCGIAPQQSVSPFYDPMLAKLIAYGENREEARRRLCQALQQSTLFGVTVNSHFLLEVLNKPAFIQGTATTTFVEQHCQHNASMQPPQINPEASALCAITLYLKSFNQQPMTSLLNWRNANPAPWPYELRTGETITELSLSANNNSYTITETDNTTIIEVVAVNSLSAKPGHSAIPDFGELVYQTGSVRRRCRYATVDKQVYLHLDGIYYRYTDLTHEAAVNESAAGSGSIIASMDGNIVDVLVTEGDKVSCGQTLIVLEAMKMEHPLKADSDGILSSLKVQAGDQVKIRQPLAMIEPETTEPGTT
ncbi:MAG: 3-methylcrotonyl-CoA carboxylase [Gammaproteobacteria bacterium]|nr:MAG: 3-methylcrotonyl-CoA carboxylase [Gammaproteobacteria bacterium]